MESGTFREAEKAWLRAVMKDWMREGVSGDRLWIISSSHGLRHEAGEVAQAVFPTGGAGLNVTADGFCLGMVRREPERAGVKPGFRPTRGPSQWVVLRDILEGTSLRSDYDGVRGGKGFTREVLAFFNSLKANGKSPRTLSRAVQKSGVHSDRLEDLDRLYGAFHEQCASQGIVSFHEMPGMAWRVLRGNTAGRTQGLVLLGADGFSPAFFDLCLTLIPECPRVAVMMDPARGSLRKGRWGRDRHKEMASLLACTPLRGSAPLPLKVMEAGNPQEEACLVASRILDLMAGDPEANLGHVLVVNGNPQAIEALAQAFGVHGIDYIAPGFAPFHGDIMVRLVWEYLRYLEGREESPLGFLASPLVGLDAAEIGRLFHRARRKGEDPGNALRCGARGCGPLLDMALDHRHKWGRGVALPVLLTEFLEASGAVRRAMDPHGPLTPSQRDAALRSLGVFLGMVREIGGLGTRARDPGRLMQDLEDCLTFLPLGHRGVENAVRVSDPRDVDITRYVFFMGVSSPMVPLPVPTAPLLPDQQRWALLGALAPIEPEPGFEPGVHLAREKAAFLRVLGSAQGGAFLSLSQSYPGVEDARPSPFLIDLAVEWERPQVPPEAQLCLPAFRAGLKGTGAPRRERDPVLVPPGFGLSASSLRTYLTCPRRFFFQYLLRLEVSPGPATTLGTLVHAVLREFHEEHGSVVGKSPEALWPGLQKRVQDKWDREFPPKTRGASEGRLRDLAGEMLHPYLMAEVKEEPRTLLGTETGFSLPYGPVVLRGIIDRVDRLPGGDVEVIDYKTGSQKEAEVTLLKAFVPSGEENWRPKDLQLYLYYLAMAGRMENPRTLSVYQLGCRSKRTGLPFKRRLHVGEGRDLDEEALSLASKALDDVIEEILSGSYLKRQDRWACSQCDFAFACDCEEGGDGDDGAE
jgi:RecB family exonuclease